MTLTDYTDLIKRVYERKPIDRVIWQPRIMLWYNGNRVGFKTDSNTPKQGALKVKFEDRHKFVPNDWIGKNIVQIHDIIDSSIRYTAETIGINYFYHQRKKEAEIKYSSITQEDRTVLTKIETPVGVVQEKSKDGYKIEKMIKQPDDIKVAKYLVENEDVFYNPFMYEAAIEELEQRGIPQCYYFRSPYQRCILEFLGFEKTTIWLRRKPEIMEDFMQFLEQWDRKQYQTILNSDLEILNFGENIDDNLSPPKIFEKFLIPYYEERVKWVHNKGKFCHIHIDGHCKNILPYLADLPFDGIEALTPEPQGDVTLEELKKYCGNKILLDVIPATLFMPQFPESRLIKCVEKIMDYFFPNLILGVSDELPGNADGRRLLKVAELAKNYKS